MGHRGQHLGNVALAMKAALFAAACLASVPFVIGLAGAATLAWYERVWLPRIAGED